MNDLATPKKPRKSRAKRADPRFARIDALGMLANFDGMMLRPVFGTASRPGSSPFFEQVGSGALRCAWADASMSSAPELWMAAGIQHGKAGSAIALSALDADNFTFHLQMGVLGRIQGLQCPSSRADIEAIDQARKSLVSELGLGILAQSHALASEGEAMLRAAHARTESFEISRDILAPAPATESHRL